jgi:hypothetical protein
VSAFLEKIMARYIAIGCSVVGALWLLGMPSQRAFAAGTWGAVAHAGVSLTQAQLAPVSNSLAACYGVGLMTSTWPVMLYRTLSSDIHAHSNKKKPKVPTLGMMYVGFFEALVELGVTAVFLGGACVACGVGGSLLGAFAPNITPWIALATAVGFVAC